MTSLLPPNATPTERAVETLRDQVGDLNVPIRQLWNAQTCPAAFLPWLAWAMSVDSWRSDWSDQTKRDVIAASPRIHRLKGTVGAVRLAASAVAGRLPSRLIEWFQPDGSGVPFRETVVVDVTNAAGAIDPGLARDIIAAANAAKPLRSRVGVRLSATAPAAVRSAALIRRPLIVATLHLSGDLRPQLGAARVSAAVMRRPLVIASLRGAAA